jgi:carbonic anhydrase
MSLIEKALEANRSYAKIPNPARAERPAPKLAVVTCMDPRVQTFQRSSGYSMRISM